LIGLRKLMRLPQGTIDAWEFDKQNGVSGLVQVDPTNGNREKIPIDRLLIFTSGVLGNFPEDVGWLEPAYRMAHMIDALEIIYGVGAQRALVGLPVFEYQTPPDEETKAEVKAIGEKLAANELQYVQLPAPLVKMNLVSVNNTNGAEVRAQIDQNRWEIHALVAATFMRLGNTESGNRALASSLIDAFSDGIDAALKNIGETYSRHLVPKLVQANPGEFAGITGYCKIVPSKVSKMPLQVMQWLGDIQTWLEKADPKDVVWLRDYLTMPHMDIAEIETQRTATGAVDASARLRLADLRAPGYSAAEQAAQFQAAARIVAAHGGTYG
jgi:hypothetical protein